ncbi:MAG: amino acid ABC transporter ATP-binding protein, partial [Synergistaceae bacterium]|nr:amino acid ABC transporter ATP-binding protein [Synergistaceae bacterium]
MIDIRNLYKNFGALSVLKGISLKVDDGEIVSVIGPSGSGKSTLLRSINLLEPPTYGEIWVDEKLITPPDPYLHFDVIRASRTYRRLQREGNGDDAALIREIKAKDLLRRHEGAEYNALLKEITRDSFVDANVVREKIGMVFQHFNLFPHMTVLQNMIYAPVHVKRTPMERAVEKARALLENVGMLDKIDVYPGTLSGGQKQRVAIAR